MTNSRTISSIRLRNNNVLQTNIKNFDNNEAAFQGDLSVVTIENLMQMVSHAGLSGELHVVAPHNAACFIIRNGELVYGYLQLKLARIGERLVQGGHISIENLQECLHFYHQKKSKLKLGEILVARKYISIEILEEVIREQVKDCFFMVLSWKEGSFSFCVNESPPEEDILLSQRIEQLILEGFIAMDDNA